MIKKQIKNKRKNNQIVDVVFEKKKLFLNVSSYVIVENKKDSPLSVR